MLFLKTPGGSSFIWLLPKSLWKDIPWLELKLYYLLCIAAVAYFFQSGCSLFELCPGQTNAFIVILNVIKQIEIYQHVVFPNIQCKWLRLWLQLQLYIGRDVGTLE